MSELTLADYGLLNDLVIAQQAKADNDLTRKEYGLLSAKLHKAHAAELERIKSERTPFEEYTLKCDVIAFGKYGISAVEVVGGDDERLRIGFKNDEDPYECVTYWGEKYGLRNTDEVIGVKMF